MQRSWTKSIVTLFAVAIVTLVALLFAVFLPADSTPAYAAEPVEGTTTTEQVSDASGVMDADALKAAVENGGEVVLGSDITADVVIPEGKTVTINLNGHTLTNDGDHTIINYGTLTVEDSSTGEPGKVDNVTHGKGALVNYGVATLTGGTFTRSKEASISSSDNGGNSWYTLKNYGEMTIEAGVNVTTGSPETSTGKFSSLIANGFQSRTDYTEKHGSVTTKNVAKLTITGGTFSGGLNTVKNDEVYSNGDTVLSSTLIISGGTFTNTSQHVIMNYGSAEISGGEFDAPSASAAMWNAASTGDDTYSATIGTANITGGKFNGGDYGIVGLDGAQITISGEASVNGKYAVILNGYTTKADLNGGTYTGALREQCADTLSVSSGDFDRAFDLDLLAPDSSLYIAADGKYTAGSSSDTSGSKVVLVADGKGYASVENAANDGVVAIVGTNGYKSVQSAVNAAVSGEAVKLIGNVTINKDNAGGKLTLTYTDGTQKTYPIGILINNKNITLDLAGHTIKLDTAYGIYGVGNLTLTSSEETRGEIVASEGTNAISVTKAEQAIIENVNINGGATAPSSNLELVSVSDSSLKICNSNVVLDFNRNGTSYQGQAISTYNSDLTLDGVTVDADSAEWSYGIAFRGNYDTQELKDALPNNESMTFKTLTIKNSKIYAQAFAVAGNGALHGTVFDITDSELIGKDGTAIYHPQYGEMTIGGATTIEGASGIEMRAGKLVIESGNVNVTATGAFTVDANGNGSTASGVAVAVSQHTTDLPIDVVIGAGTYSATGDDGKAFYETDTVSASPDSNGVTVALKGGNYTAPVVSENKKSFVSGGTFSEGVDLAYVADGQQVGIKSDGGMEVADEISGEGYDAIYDVSDNEGESTATATVYTADALNDAVSAGVDVVLGSDIKANVVIPEGKTVTIDLNGYTLTNDGDHTIINYGTLTVEDSSTGETGKVDNVTHGKAAIYNEVDATFTLASGTLDRTKEAGTSSSSSGDNSYYTLLNHGTAYINGGTIQQGGLEVGKYSSLVENGWYDGSKNTEKKPSIMTVNGGTFLGGLNSIKNDDYGELNIIYATVKNVAQAALLNWNVATIEGGSFSTDGGSAVILNGYINDTMDKGELTITGGTFTTNGGDFPLIARMDGSKPTGGVITVTVTSTNADLVAAAINVPGVTTYVKEGDAVTEMSVSDLAGLKEALNTETVEKITIGADFEISGNRIEIGDINDPNAATRSITLDLNGHTLKIGTIRVSDTDSSANTAALYLGYNVSLTLTDTVGSGTIDASGANDLTVPIGAMRSSSTLIVKRGTIIVDTDRESCVFARGGGKIVIIGGTFINNCTSEYAYGGGRPLTVNIENNSTSTIDITGGTFKGRNPMSGDDNTDVAFVSKDSKVVEYKSGNMEVVDQNSEVTGDDVVAVYTYADNETGDTVATVYTEDALRAALADKNYDTVVLGADIGNASETFVIDRPVTLDLNGYTLENKNTTSGNYLLIEGGNSEAENIKVTIRNGNISSGDAAVFVMGYVDVVMENVSVKTDGRYGLELYGECDQSVTAEGCTFEGDTSGVAVFGAEKTGMTAAFSATDCTIKGGDYGVSGNGTYHLTTIDIVDSKVSSDRGTAIYHPQVGTLTIRGGSEISGISGIEMRAGTLKISGNVSVVATAEEFSVSDLGDGPRFDGVALGVSRYFEGSDVGVTLDISGGTFVAQDKGYAFYEKDVSVPEAEDNTSLSFAGATFNGDLYSENETGFIKSGTFSEGVDLAYVADGQKVGVKPGGGMEVGSEISGEGFDAIYTVSGDENASMSAIVYTADMFKKALDNDSVTEITLGKDFGGSYTIDRDVTIKAAEGVTFSGNIVIESSSVTRTTGPNVKLEGVAFKGNGSGTAISVKNGSLTITGGSIKDYDNGIVAGTRGGAAVDISVDNVEFTELDEKGIYGEAFGDLTVKNSTFNGADNDASGAGNPYSGRSAAAIDINQTVAGGSVSITGNTFVDCGDNGSTSGAIKIKVRDISVEQSYGQAGDFAAEHNELVGSFEAVSVTNNTFTNCSRDIVVGTGYVAKTYVDMTQSGNESYESDGTTTRDLIFVDNAHVDDAESLMNAFADEDLVLIEVFANITTTDIIVVDKPGKSVVLDLNGYTITANDTTTSTENGVSIGAGFLYLADGTLTVKDGTVNAIEDSFRVQTEATDDYAKLILADDLTVTSQNANAVYIRALNQQESTTPNAVLETAADLKVSGKYAAIQGNGTSTDGPVSVTVTGGDIVADPADETIDGTGLYLPGRGEYLITGGTITAPTGVEFRAGTLTITGGTITATGEFAADPNGNGATTSGVAVAMMQHTTERDLTLNITGGEFNGAYAVYQQNIQNNDSGTLTMSLSGGTFNGNVDSENCTEYISGGQYSVKPAAEAFKPGFDGVEYDGYYVVIETTTDDIAALLAARIDAQADVRTYAAVLGIDWKAMEALADTDDVAAAALDAYNAIGNATSEGYVAIARSAAMDALDAYAAAMAESELEAAKLKAQTTVKMYIASADIGGWTNLLLIKQDGVKEEKDAVAPIFAMYDMIEESTTVADIDAYMWKAISQVDTYVNALENWRKAAADEVTAAAQETAENANDAVVVPTSVYAAINGAVNYTEVNAYKTNALAEIADIRAYRADIAEQGSELDLIYGTLTEFKNAFDVLDASLTGENNAFDTLLKDVQDAITTAQNAITGGTDESSESLASIKSYLENTIYKAMTDFKADVDTAFDDLGSNLAAYGDVLIALRDALVGDGTDGSVGKIDEILADIADAQSDITNIKTTVGSLATTEDLTTAVTDIKGALTVSEGKITSAITAAQNAITSAIASVRTDIDALETALAGYESDFEGLSGTLAQINSSLGGKIDAAQADIDAIKTAIDALGTPASAAAVTELATAIDELKAAVDEISVSVSAPSAVETVKTEATADIAEWLNAYVDEIVNSVTASNGKAYAAAVTFAPALETTDGDLYAKLLKAFDKDNADLVLKYYNDALTAIDAATTADEVNTAVATFKAQVASVEAASGNTSDLTVVYVLLIVVLVVLVVAVVVAAVLSRKRRVPVGYAPAPTPAPAPATSETTEQTEKAAPAEKPEVTDDTAATAVEPDEAPDEDAGERVVINASVKTFDEAYDEMSDTLKDMFEKVREYALSKNGATGVRIGNGVRVKRGSKQIVKLTVRRGYPVAMFVLENEMLKDYRRTAGSSAKLKVPATELVLREPSDLDAAYMMVDLAVRQLDADVEAAKERRRELLRERRRQRREAMEAAKAAQAAQAEATTEQAEPTATEQNEAATPEQAVDEDKTE